MSPKILIVDDDAHLRFALALSLKISGFKIDTVGNGRDALAKILGSIAVGRPYDLLITDMIMPEMNGLELVEELNDAGVGIPVLVMSSYPGGVEIIGPLSRDRIACFLEKPFNMEEMVSSVNVLLKKATPCAKGVKAK